tara:strand:- start:1087 stop:1668 length:582 start_codon:yes stop_codon:yes gene_type:complete
MANVRQYAPLATAGEVISNSFTNANTDTALISNNTIVQAELAHIKSVLGEKFYEELKTQHNNGTLTVANQALMDDFLVPCLSWFVRFEVVIEMQMNSTSAGIVTNIDDFGNPVNSNELNEYKQSTYRKAEIFLKDMLDFLDSDDENGNYPTYESNRPAASIAYKNHGIIFYDSIYERQTNYNSWRNYCPPSWW